MSARLGRTVLLVSRQPELCRQLRVMLARQGARLLECRRAGDVEDLLLSQQPDLILLDLTGHDAMGVQATHVIRARTNLPLIVLVTAGDEEQRLRALHAGADDCAALPFVPSEMRGRMRTALRRTERSTAQSPPGAFNAGAVEVDFVAREVRLRGKPVHVTPTEYKLLRVLLESEGQVVTHERLLREVWGQAATRSVPRLRVHMKQLQRKFERGAPFALSLTVTPAVGYRLRVHA